MSVEIGSRATYRGEPVVVVERKYANGGVWHWRILYPNNPVVVNGTVMGLRSFVLPGLNLQDVTPPPAFEVGQRVRVIGRKASGVVFEIAERDGRTKYGVDIPHHSEVVKYDSPRLAYYGPEYLEAS